MKLFSGLTAGVSLAAFMAVSTPAKAQSLLESESLDQGYGQSQQTGEEKKKDDKKKDKKKDDKGKKDGHCGKDKGEHEGACGDDKKGDKEEGCGEGTCG